MAERSGDARILPEYNYQLSVEASLVSVSSLTTVVTRYRALSITTTVSPTLTAELFYTSTLKATLQQDLGFIYDNANDYTVWKIESPFPIKSVSIMKLKYRSASGYLKLEYSTDNSTFVPFAVFVSTVDTEDTTQYRLPSGVENYKVIYIKASYTAGSANNYIQSLDMRVYVDDLGLIPLPIEPGTTTYVVDKSHKSHGGGAITVYHRGRST